MNRQLVRTIKRSNDTVLQVLESDDDNNLYVNDANLTFDEDGNLLTKSSAEVGGQVEVTNFPTDQTVSINTSNNAVKVFGHAIDYYENDSYPMLRVDEDGYLYNVARDGYGWHPEYTPQGEMRVVEPVRLAGSQFNGTTLDPNFWTASVGTGGTIAQANGLLTISSGTTANNNVSYQSNSYARYIGGSTNRFRANVRTNNQTTNTDGMKRWGMFDANNGAWFFVDGTGYGIGYRKAGSDTTVYKTSWYFDPKDTSGTTGMPSYFTYEIYITNSRIVWVVSDPYSISGVVYEVITGSNTTVNKLGSLNLPVRFECNNTNGSTVNKSLYVLNGVIHRLGKAETQSKSSYIPGVSAGTVCKYGPGTVHRVIFSAGSNGDGVTLYDNTAASGTIISQFTATNNITAPVEFNVPFNTGLTVVTTGTGSYCTVIYE
jgi:hypothetical protein